MLGLGVKQHPGGPGQWTRGVRSWVRTRAASCLGGGVPRVPRGRVPTPLHSRCQPEPGGVTSTQVEGPLPAPALPAFPAGLEPEPVSSRGGAVATGGVRTWPAVGRPRASRWKTRAASARRPALP